MAKSPTKSAASRAASQSAQSSSEAIASFEAADSALQELGRMAALERRLSAECDARLGKIRAEFAARMFIEVDGTTFAIADRAKALVAGLQAFTQRNRKEIETTGKKSVTLNHGEIGWRKSPDKLLQMDGVAGERQARVLDKAVAFLRLAVDRFKLFIGKPTRQFLRVQVSFDRSALLQAFRQGDLSAKDLGTIGLRLEAGQDTFFVDAKTQEIASQPERAPE